ncbi:MAG: M43 family zinc metalloprotease [Bacteroidia bacterium]|nr:M43 family zinc metalloprotease [Bacteroidia bacterium]
MQSHKLLLLLFTGWMAGQSWCGTLMPPPLPPSFFHSPRTGVARTGWPDTSCRPHAQYVVPVVFHVIHSGGVDSIPLSAIETQMERLFEDMRRIPETRGFTPHATDMEVEFALATKDPNGQPTTGVVYWRYDQPPLSWPEPKLCVVTNELNMKNATAWPRDKYLNIWIVPQICEYYGSSDCDDCNDAIGYAYFPSTDPAYLPYFGTVQEYSTIGDEDGINPRRSRVLVHELGHNLSLAHTFNEGCDSTSDCENEGDYICDTPPTAEPNYQFRQQNTCSTDVPDRPDETRNYMDYTPSYLMCLFTEGQKAAATWWLSHPNSYYAPLTQSSNLQATGTGPYGRVRVRFWAESHRVLVGTPVRFHAVTEGQPHLYIWDFSGGIADDPSSPCPTVTFPAAGVYSVQLIAENLSGRRDTAFKANYIVVEDAILSLPYTEDWEGGIPPHITIENLDAGYPLSRTWETYPAGAYGLSDNCININYLNHPLYGERDYLTTPAFQMPEATTHRAFLIFSVSYTCLDWSDANSFLLRYGDTLRVWVSPDGGGHWELLYEKGGIDLSTFPNGCRSYYGNLNGADLPPLHWRTDTIPLTNYLGLAGVRFRFEAVAGGGGRIFIDDIRIEKVLLGERIEDPYELTPLLFSNPQTHGTYQHWHYSLVDSTRNRSNDHALNTGPDLVWRLILPECLDSLILHFAYKDEGQDGIIPHNHKVFIINTTSSDTIELLENSYDSYMHAWAQARNWVVGFADRGPGTAYISGSEHSMKHRQGTGLGSEAPFLDSLRLASGDTLYIIYTHDNSVAEGVDSFYLEIHALKNLVPTSLSPFVEVTPTSEGDGCMGDSIQVSYTLSMHGGVGVERYLIEMNELYNNVVVGQTAWESFTPTGTLKRRPVSRSGSTLNQGYLAYTQQWKVRGRLIHSRYSTCYDTSATTEVEVGLDLPVRPIPRIRHQNTSYGNGAVLTLSQGQNVTFTAIEREGIAPAILSHTWYLNGSLVGTAPTLTINVPRDTSNLELTILNTSRSAPQCDSTIRIRLILPFSTSLPERGIVPLVRTENGRPGVWITLPLPGVYQIKIYDRIGRLCLESRSRGGEETFYPLPAGLYLLVIEGEHSFYRRPLLIAY